MTPAVKDLVLEYGKRKNRIKERLCEFAALYKGGNVRIFKELCFCLLTANANAVLCDKAITEMEEAGLLIKGSASRIRPKLKGRVRFHNKKASFLVGARKLFGRVGRIEIKKRLDSGDIPGTRDWLVENVKGLGYKEASHFLRNIGLGDDIAILDRHILKNLKKYGVIKDIPSSLGNRKAYLDIEDRMRRFSRKTGIPLPDLDLLFWSIETGFVFK